MSQQYERDLQSIGRGHEIFLRGDTVVLRIDYKGELSERNFSPREALKLLTWLHAHIDELFQSAQVEEMEGYE